MTPEEKAKELFDKFHQYLWNDREGYMPDDIGTKNIVNKVINEIQLQADDWGISSNYWIDVRIALYKI
jgi:hypothetical protein